MAAQASRQHVLTLREGDASVANTEDCVSASTRRRADEHRASLQTVGAQRQKGKILCYTNIRWPGPGNKGDFRTSPSPWSKGKHKASGREGRTGSLAQGIWQRRPLKSESEKNPQGLGGFVRVCEPLPTSPEHPAESSFHHQASVQVQLMGFTAPPEGVAADRGWSGASPDVVLGFILLISL